MREQTTTVREWSCRAIGATAIIAIAGLVETVSAQLDDDRAIVIRKVSGWPDAPVGGASGPYLSVRSTLDRALWSSAALPITLDQKTKVISFAGVMAAPSNFDWPGATWRFNVWSNLEAFGADGLVGDVISLDGVVIANLDGSAPPAFGGLTADHEWQKRYVEFAFASFPLLAGDHLFGISAFSDSGEVGWAEAIEIGDLTSDFGTSSINNGSPFPFSELPLAVTGVVAADIGGQLPPPPIGDLNGDGVVDGADLGILLSAWGDCAGCPADLNADGVVNGEDLGILLLNWTE